MSDSVRPQRRQPTRLPCPWDSLGKNTGVGWHFLLQCMKVKSQSEVAQSCLTPSDLMDCSRPGSSVHGIFQARVLEWGAIDLTYVQIIKYIFRSNLCFLLNKFLATFLKFQVSRNLSRKYRRWKWKSLSHVWLCDPMDCSLPASSVHGILQARVPKWVAVLFPREASQSRDETQVPHTADVFFTILATREAQESTGFPHIPLPHLLLWLSLTSYVSVVNVICSVMSDSLWPHGL